MQPAMSRPLELPNSLSREYLLHHRICPADVRDDGTIVLAIAPDALLDAADEIAAVYGSPIVTEPRTKNDVERLIERLTTRADRTIELSRVDTSADDLATDVRNLANQPPVIRFVNLLVRDAHD